MKPETPRQFVQIERRNKLSREEFSEVISNLERLIWKNLKTEALPFRKLSGRRDKSFLMTAFAPLPDCQTCGACCTALPCVDVKEIDSTPAENYWEIVIGGQDEIVVNRQLKRDLKTGNCLALEGSVGEFVKCGIYESRPDDCRKFEAGSDRCRALRRAYGIEPSLTELETAHFMMRVFLKDEPEGDERVIYHAQIQKTETAGLFEIKVFLNDETVQVIHRFNTFEESWLEGDFSGLTLHEAKNLIASRRKVSH